MKHALLPIMLVAASALTGCQQTSQNLEPTPVKIVNTMSLINTKQFAQRPAIAPKEQLFKLPTHAKEQFLDYYHSNTQSDVVGHKRIYNYLSNRLNNFNYFHKSNTLTYSIRVFSV